jgi:hypothetical protein
LVQHLRGGIVGVTRAAAVGVLWHFRGMVVEGMTLAWQWVLESGSRCAVALLEWHCQTGIGGVGRKGEAAMANVARRCQGGGGASGRAAGGRAVVLVGLL